MEATTLTVRGETAGRFAETFVERKATESERSINKRGVRNIHRYGGEAFTFIAYERGSVHESSWLVVSLLVEQVDERTATVALFVGGGGEGPFKLEELNVTRLLRGEEAVGQAGRFATVLRDVEAVCDALGLTVETAWQSETETSTARKLARKLLDT